MGWWGPYPGRGPWSWLPPPLRPGWWWGRGWCWWYWYSVKGAPPPPAWPWLSPADEAKYLEELRRYVSETVLKEIDRRLEELRRQAQEGR